MPDVKKEVLGWRDEWLSRKHREWGWNLPGTDIDFLFIEYDRCIPVALIDYKHKNSKPIYFNKSANSKAYKNLADMAGIYAFCVKYCRDEVWFKIAPLNQKGKSILLKYAKNVRPTFSEKEYVDFMYFIRKRRPSNEQ